MNRKLLTAVLGIVLGLAAKASAVTYVTVTSTGVCFSTNVASSISNEWPYAVVEVRTSTPALSTSNEARLVLIDTAAISFSQTKFQRADREGVTIATENIDAQDFTAGQYIVPPFLIVASTQGGVSTTQLSQPNQFQIGGPFGYVPRNGFCAAASNTGATNLFYITVGFEAIPTGGYPRRQ